MLILVANIGSTSFKYRLLRMDGERVLARGKIERISPDNATCPDYETAIRRCIAEISGLEKPIQDLAEVSAVAFKAVHAGPITGARVVDDTVLAAMEEFSFFAPAHNPPYIAAMRAFRSILPHVPLVALFETAFFENMTNAAVTYAVPHNWQTVCGIRRYGFHGASHRAASEYVTGYFKTNSLRHISCHLGGSSSVAAIRDGVAIDTTFGISPQSGLPQNNRVGEIDPYAVLYMMKKLGVGVDEMAEILSSKCGLAGISGISGDVRDLESAAQKGHANARLALEVFVRAVKHAIGSFFVELGGLDVLTFAGGIGENSTDVRAAICRGLSPLGIGFDEDRNLVLQGRGLISTDASLVKVLVVPADEETIVARAAAGVITQSSLFTKVASRDSQ
jgi:acetate kinase